MLGDRNYMRGSYPNSNGRNQFFFGDGRQMVYLLIGINIFCYLFLGQRNNAFSVNCMKDSFAIYQLITAMFFHANFTHIFFNMYGLYLFGKLLAPLLNGGKILLLYLLGGFVGNTLFLALNWNQPQMLLGASGALYAFIIAVAMLRPNLQFMMLIPPIPLKSRTLAIVYAVIEILLQFADGGSNIAHLAHLGGLLAGYVYIRLVFRHIIEWDPLGFLFRGTGQTSSASRPKSNAGPHLWSRSGNSNQKISSQDLDYLLEKVSRSGINSLTPEEMDVLRKTREQMRGKH